MRKKVIIIMSIILIMCQTIFPVYSNAFSENTEIISMPAKIERQKSDNTSGMDTFTGMMVEPIVEFVTFIIDVVTGTFSSFMTQTDYQHVMVDDIDQLPDYNDTATTTFTIEEEDVDLYRNFIGNLNLKYPYFTYSPEEIFAGKIDLLDINFIDATNGDNNWQNIRKVVSQWYKTIRMIAIIGLLSVLIYTGIKIIISSTAKDKSKYKEMIVNWFIAVILLFSMHYIMAFILSIIEEIMGLLQGITGLIKVILEGEDIEFVTNLIGLARFQMQQVHFSAKIGYLVIYTALVVYTFKFTFMYLKRVLSMAFLTVIAPIVALTYPIDKMNGQAKGFQMWLKEYMYNAILQPMHYILYYILVSSSLALAANNPIYGIAALMFISHAERLLKRIFGFDKANAGTVGGLAGAFATGAITSRLTNLAKNPLHPFGGGSGSGSKSGGSSGETGDGSSEENEIQSTRNDYNLEDFLGINTRANPITPESVVPRGSTPVLNSGVDNEETRVSGENEEIDSATGDGIQENPESIINPIVTGMYEEDADGSLRLPVNTQGSTIQGIDDLLYRYRAGLPITKADLNSESFSDGDSESIDEMIQELFKYMKELNNSNNTPEQQKQLHDRIGELIIALNYGIMSNEIRLSDDGRIPLQYTDGDKRTSNELMDEIIRLYTLSIDAFIPSNERRNYRRQAEKLLKILKTRMAQNRYIEKQGGVQLALQKERNRLMPSEGDLTVSAVAMFTGLKNHVVETGNKEILDSKGQLKEGVEKKEDDKTKSVTKENKKRKEIEEIELGVEEQPEVDAELDKEVRPKGVGEFVKEEQTKRKTQSSSELKQNRRKVLKLGRMLDRQKELDSNNEIDSPQLSSREEQLGLGEQPSRRVQLGLGRQPRIRGQLKLGQRPGRQAQLGLGEQPSRQAQLGLGEQPSRQAQLGLGEKPSRQEQLGLGQRPSRQEQLGLAEQPNRLQPRNPETQTGEQQGRRWVRFKNAPVTKGLANVGKTIIKPAWDAERDVRYNRERLVGNIINGVAGVTVGITAAAVQAGISITDGKYNVLEGVGTVGAGILGVRKLGRNADGIVQTYKDAAYEGNDEKLMEEYGHQWFNRDDVIISYNREFPGQGKAMRRRALNNYVTRGITDVKEQTRAIKYAEQLKRERGIDEEEADRRAVATLQYRRELLQNSNYGVLYNEEERLKYIDTKVEAYTGSAARASIRQLHIDFIDNVRDFDRANI